MPDITTGTTLIVSARKDDGPTATRPMTWGALSSVLHRVAPETTVDMACLILGAGQTFAFDGPNGVFVTARVA